MSFLNINETLSLAPISESIGLLQKEHWQNPNCDQVVFVAYLLTIIVLDKYQAETQSKKHIDASCFHKSFESLFKLKPEEVNGLRDIFLSYLKITRVDGLEECWKQVS